MNRLIELASKLTPAQVNEVEQFAEFLAQRRKESSADLREGEAESQKKISFEGWAGCMAHVEPDKSDKELIREAWDDLMRKYAGTPAIQG